VRGLARLRDSQKERAKVMSSVASRVYAGILLRAGLNHSSITSNHAIVAPRLVKDIQHGCG
jgi:hypothetical protein